MRIEVLMEAIKWIILLKEDLKATIITQTDLKQKYLVNIYRNTDNRFFIVKLGRVKQEKVLGQLGLMKEKEFIRKH